MDNGIENPANDMSVQENSQKLANDLNLALDMGYERGAADSGLYTGYDSGSNTWELIVKYTGDIQSVAKRFGASAVVLLGGYAIVTMPQEHINEFADCAEVVYIENRTGCFFRPAGIGALMRILCVERTIQPEWGRSACSRYRQRN